MANSRTPGPLHPPSGMYRIPARTNGPSGLLDQGDPNVTTLRGDTPGPLGFNDGNDPTIGPFGSALARVTFISKDAAAVALENDSAMGKVATSVKLPSSAWARTEPSRGPKWNAAASDRVMKNLLASSERFAENKAVPSMWDQITEKGKAVWDSTSEALDDAGRALRRAVTIGSPEEAREKASQIELRRAQSQMAADLRAHGWGDNGLACVRLGPTVVAVQPAAVNPAYYDSFDQRIARSTNEGLQLYAGGALIDAVAIPVLTAGGKLAVRFLSEETKLSYGLRRELRSSIDADLRPLEKFDRQNQKVGGNRAADPVSLKIAKERASQADVSTEAKTVAVTFDRAKIEAQLVEKLGSNIRANPLRIEYENKVSALSSYADNISPGMGQDELFDLATEANQARRLLGVEYKNVTPEPLRDFIYEMNSVRYGDPLGPDVNYLVNQGRTYTEIIESASRPNPNVDVLLSKFGEWLEGQPTSYIKKYMYLIKE